MNMLRAARRARAESGPDSTRLRRILAGAAAVGLATAALVATAAPASAEYATGGSGRFPGLIDWMEWGAHGATITSGATASTTRAVGDAVLDSTCELTNLNGGLIAYRPGMFPGDGFDDLYHVGGTGNANQLVVGLTNTVASTTVTFDISCGVTLDGVDVPIQGLVIGDAETSSNVGDEYVGATPHQEATWRIIDRHRIGCDRNTQAELTGDTLRLVPEGAICPTAGPMAVAFMEGATSATVSLHGGGRSAVAVGIVLGADFGDAPDGYGAAGAIVQPTWSGGVVPEGITPVSDDEFALATLAEAEPRLGATVDAEGAPASSPDAAGDGADEDDFAGIPPIDPTPGAEFELTELVCTGDATVAAWLDWDHDGQFADDEAATAVPCVDGTAALTWTVPADVHTAPASDPTFLRVRIASDPAQLTPTGMSLDGEVEDYAVEILGEPLFLGCTPLITFDEGSEGWRVATTVNGTQVVMAPVAVDWDATGGNPGGTVVSDDLDGNWTELWTPALAANGYSLDYSSAAGTDLQFDYRNTTGIGYDVYVTLRGTNGASYYFDFRDQIVDSTVWTRVVVPLVASEWVTGFDNNSGPVGSAPSDAAFLEALSEVDRFAFSIEGRLGADTSYFDNFGQPCDDWSDASTSYGTASHRADGYDAGTSTAPLMLGELLDIEEGAQPGDGAVGDGAVGDDETGAADEDGLAVNPDAGVDAGALRAGFDHATSAPAENVLEVVASAAGFVSVWVDWNGDGDFDDAAEMVLASEPVDAGTTELTVARGEAPAVDSTYLRVRYGSTSAATGSPTGPAPDGEVEDYLVALIEPEPPAPTVPGLVNTGAPIPALAILAGALAVLAGIAVLVVRRRVA